MIFNPSEVLPENEVSVSISGVTQFSVIVSTGMPGKGVKPGGTTGQILAKLSSTDYDTTWENVPASSWGSITGSLSSQGDLQTALNQKASTGSLASAISALAPVAASGSYSDLTGKPTLGTAASQNVSAFDSAGAASSPTASYVGINSKTVGNTLIYSPVSAGKVFVATEVVIRCTAASAITSGPTIGIGTSSGANDIFASTAISALTTVNSIFGFSLVGMSVCIPSGGTMYLNLSSAATGTSQTISADVRGYFV